MDVEFLFAIKISGKAVPRRHNEARKWHGRMQDLFTDSAQTLDECLEEILMMIELGPSALKALGPSI